MRVYKQTKPLSENESFGMGKTYEGISLSQSTTEFCALINKYKN